MLKCVVVLSSVFVVFNTSFGQWYYPLETGNVWEYWDNYPIPQKYAWTNRIVGDTIMPNAATYQVVRSDAWPDEFQRKLGPVVLRYNTFLQKEEPLFDFSKNAGDTICVSIQNSDTIVTTIIDDTYDLVLGVRRRVFLYLQQWKSRSAYIVRTVTDSLGLVRMTYEPGEGGRLYGAIINGIQYGTITHVSSQARGGATGVFLRQNYPNPFNPKTTIQYTVSQNTFVKLSVLNILGQEVTTLVSGIRHRGTDEEIWDASHYPSGVYFYKLVAGAAIQTKPMLLLK